MTAGCPFGVCPHADPCRGGECTAFAPTPDALWQVPHRPEPCQGCSMVADAMTECIHVCDGMTSEADLIERAAAWRAFREVIDRQKTAYARRAVAAQYHPRSTEGDAPCPH